MAMTAARQHMETRNRYFVENWTVALRHGDLHGPRLCKCRRIVNRELVKKRVRIQALEAFREPHVLAGSSEGRLVCEIRRLDDQGIAFPMAARVSFPLADILWKMRTPIEGNDAGVM